MVIAITDRILLRNHYLNPGVGENSLREKRFWNSFFKKVEKRIFFQIIFSKSRKKNLFSNSFFEKLKKESFFKFFFPKKEKRFFFQKSFFQKRLRKEKNYQKFFSQIRGFEMAGTDHFWSDSSSAERKIFFVFICSQSVRGPLNWSEFLKGMQESSDRRIGPNF